VRLPAALAYYITAHGYGHGVRSCDILRAINDLRPDLRVIVVTDLPWSLLQNRLPSPTNSYRAGSFDVGMVQIDSIRVDMRATLDRVEGLYGRRRELIAQESAFLRDCGVGCVVADIPAIPFEAAADAGVPGIAVGNFGWDWIYSSLAQQDPRWSAIASAFRQGYEAATLLVRLPFAEEMQAFKRREDVPVVASRGRARRKEIAALYSSNPAKKWILLSFTSLDWDVRALRKVQRLTDYEFFTVRPLAWDGTRIRAVERERVPFSDLIASVDGVVSKPGFGIVSECVVNRKPLIFADRTDFAEYAVLESAIRRYLQHRHIPAEQLYAGELGDALHGLWTQPEPLEAAPQGGAPMAAKRILEFLPCT
jgi:L-arabinokinase